MNQYKLIIYNCSNELHYSFMKYDGGINHGNTIMEKKISLDNIYSTENVVFLRNIMLDTGDKFPINIMFNSFEHEESHLIRKNLSKYLYDLDNIQFRKINNRDNLKIYIN